MPEYTITLIHRRAAECGVPAFGAMVEARMRAGMKRFGRDHHLTADTDWLAKALAELADAWAYLCIIERTGGRIPEELWTSLAVSAAQMMVLQDVGGEFAGHNIEDGGGAMAPARGPSG